MGRERQSKLEFSPGRDHHHMILYIKTFIFFKELFISEVEICNDKQSTWESKDAALENWFKFITNQRNSDVKIWV